ncbi:uncharacterized protein LOC134533755 isoform X2 [Bacillus rossius redtenbacheri]|uniref:uncharacterized protein LOC134533755 isoform X2 n=1 Tax=Bacillus rossius redtenbacheri TaxID=93214 RepID=UPI002FDD48C5
MVAARTCKMASGSLLFDVDTWADIKSNARRKTVDAKAAKLRTGNKNPVVVLSTLDERILFILGPASSDGMPLEEGDFGLQLMDVELHGAAEQNQNDLLSFDLCREVVNSPVAEVISPSTSTAPSTDAVASPTAIATPSTGKGAVKTRLSSHHKKDKLPRRNLLMKRFGDQLSAIQERQLAADLRCAEMSKSNCVQTRIAECLEKLLRVLGDRV